MVDKAWIEEETVLRKRLWLPRDPLHLPDTPTPHPPSTPSPSEPPPPSPSSTFNLACMGCPCWVALRHERTPSLHSCCVSMLWRHQKGCSRWHVETPEGMQ